MTNSQNAPGTGRTAGSATRRRPIPPPPPRRPTTESDRVPTQPPVEATDPTALVTIRAWVDPLMDDTGHDPRSRYVELFWLGVLGPTATWLLRRLVSGLDQHPDGYEIDLGLTARMMGMSYTSARSSPFSKALQRCTMFGLAHQTSDGLAVRRRIPAVAYRHLRRMPDAAQAAHAAWVTGELDIDEFARAHRLALAMLESGDDAATIEHHLVA
ncbi:hypothetical protein, partial [Ilumatobacter sp.]|uniref:hypothetical protein n=1 Tax=Ilumatobacter sp. TaxID=1967498 RepID=UPI003C6056CB